MDENMKEILKKNDPSNGSNEPVALDGHKFDDTNDVLLDTELCHGNDREIELAAIDEKMSEKNDKNEKDILIKKDSSDESKEPIASDDINMDAELNQSNVKKFRVAGKEEYDDKTSEKKSEDSEEISKMSFNGTTGRATLEKKSSRIFDENEPDDAKEIEPKEVNANEGIKKSSRLYKLEKNLKFYKGEIKSKPDGDYIDQILNNWYNNYDLLELHHGYIQWLFPNVDPGLNFHSQPLQQEELEIMKSDQEILKKILSSFRMMLNFYGMQIDDEKTKMIKKSKNYKKRYTNLKNNRHNFLRITRILKCLAEFELVDYQYAWIDFLMNEIYLKKELRILERSMENFFVQTIKNDEKRNEFIKKIEEYKKSE